MRHLFVPAMIIAGLALAQPALSATTPAASPAARTAPAPVTATAKVDPLARKHAACEKTWTDQKKHTGKHKAFVAACVAKG
jgi:hypothetical protein